MYQPKHNFTMVAGKYRIRVDRSVWGTVLTIIIINTNHKEGKKRIHTPTIILLWVIIYPFLKSFAPLPLGKHVWLPFARKFSIIYWSHLFSYFALYYLIFSWPVFKILFCLLNLYCQKPVIIQSKKVTYSLIGDLVKNISFVFIWNTVFLIKWVALD